MTAVWNTQLTPLTFLGRSAEVYPDKTAIVYGDRRHTYREFAAEATRVAHALRGSGVEPGDRVAYLLPNIPEMLVAHFAVPLAGAVLVAINTRLSTEEIRYILDHSGCRLLVVDAALYPMVAPVAGELKTVEEIITVIDPRQPGRRHRLRRHLRRPARPRQRRRPPVDRRRRRGHDLDQLHVRDDGAAQGRDVPPPRRAPELLRRDRALVAHPGQRLPVDAADVPLQRLVHPVGGHGDRRHARVPARGARRRDLVADPRARRHPPQRRADRRHHDPARQGRRRPRDAAS